MCLNSIGPHFVAVLGSEIYQPFLKVWAILVIAY